MLKLSLKTNDIDKDTKISSNEIDLNGIVTNTDISNETETKIKNSWSGYHVKFRNPRKFEEFAIDEQFNKWGDMVEFFKQQEKPYRLSQGSLKDLLYGTYKRKGMHSLSLNDLVTIEKVGREKITKSKNKSEDDQQENHNLVKVKPKPKQKAESDLIENKSKNKRIVKSKKTTDPDVQSQVVIKESEIPVEFAVVC